VKKHLQRRFKATIHQMLAAEQTWAIHEPALGSLLGVLSLGEDLDKPEIAAALSMADGAAPTTQIVGNVAVLGIFGVLSQKSSWVTRALGWTSTEQLERDYVEALNNTNVKAIVFLVDSPGGSAIGNEETSKTIFAGRGKKPTYAFGRGIVASAAYYLASAADKVYASPSTTIGSIGAVSTHVEYSKALAEAGYGVNVIRSAPNKQLWNQFEKLTPDAKASMQAWVNAYGNQFEQAVARHRGVSQADVKAKFGQGDVYLAAEATTRGLIDGVMSFEQLLLKAQGSSPAPVSAESAVPPLAQVTTPEARTIVLEALSADASGSSDTASSAPLSPAAAEPAAPLPSSTMKISARVRAALFARGFVTEQSDDATCLVALGAFFAARGEACPQDDENKVVAALMTSAPTAQAPAKPEKPATPATPVTADLVTARSEAATGERQRQKDIRASAKLLNMPAASIDAAIDAGTSHAEVVAGWHTELARREKPIEQGGDAKVTGDGHQRFVADATMALQLRTNSVLASEQAKVSDSARDLSQAPLSYFAEKCLQAAGVRVPEFIAKEDLMEMAFAMDGQNRVTIGANGAYSPYNRPGSFPNLLSNLAGKILDSALELAEPTYGEYTGQITNDLPDFKPVPIVAKGQVDELDEVLDAEASKEFGLAEELVGMMVLRRFSNKFELTPVMAANDDLDAFQEGLLGLETGWQNTINRACLRILTGNALLLDGNALFDNTNHGNDITAGSGGVPSDAQWDAMNLKVAAQRGIGGTGYIRTPLKIALMAPALWRVATQSLGDFRVVGESKVPTLDTNVNIYRGTVTLVREAELQATSNAVWYGFCQPRGANASIIRAYFRGWGKNGRRQRWYDPNTKVWNFELEGRVGAAPKQYRTLVRNAGS
jgi:signal peptide peptidase SppA